MSPSSSSNSGVFSWCLILTLLSSSSARFLAPVDVPAQAEDNDSNPGAQGADLGGVPEFGGQEVGMLDSGLSYYGPPIPEDAFYPDTSDLLSALQYDMPSVSRDGTYSTQGIWKRGRNHSRSRLNRLIERLLRMRGDRYSHFRASPVRFAAGRR